MARLYASTGDGIVRLDEEGGGWRVERFLDGSRGAVLDPDSDGWNQLLDPHDPTSPTRRTTRAIRAHPAHQKREPVTATDLGNPRAPIMRLTFADGPSTSVSVPERGCGGTHPAGEARIHAGPSSRMDPSWSPAVATAGKRSSA